MRIYKKTKKTSEWILYAFNLEIPIVFFSNIAAVIVLLVILMLMGGTTQNENTKLAIWAANRGCDVQVTEGGANWYCVMYNETTTISQYYQNLQNEENRTGGGVK